MQSSLNSVFVHRVVDESITRRDAAMRRRTDRISDENLMLRLCIFMLVFWPLSLVLGVIDHWFVPDRDLRLLNLAMGALAGWYAVRRFEAKRQETGLDTSEHHFVR
jgi:hypothetical protein